MTYTFIINVNDSKYLFLALQRGWKEFSLFKLCSTKRKPLPCDHFAFPIIGKFFS